MHSQLKHLQPALELFELENCYRFAHRYRTHAHASNAFGTQWNETAATEAPFCLSMRLTQIHNRILTYSLFCKYLKTKTEKPNESRNSECENDFRFGSFFLFGLIFGFAGLVVRSIIDQSIRRSIDPSINRSVDQSSRKETLYCVLGMRVNNITVINAYVCIII